MFGSSAFIAAAGLPLLSFTAAVRGTAVLCTSHSRTWYHVLARSQTGENSSAHNTQLLFDTGISSIRALRLANTDQGKQRHRFATDLSDSLRTRNCQAVRTCSAKKLPSTEARSESAPKAQKQIAGGPRLNTRKINTAVCVLCTTCRLWGLADKKCYNKRRPHRAPSIQYTARSLASFPSQPCLSSAPLPPPPLPILLSPARM